jgi:phosphohistidine phosphatase
MTYADLGSYLWILRHAQAEAEGSADDHARALTAKGEGQARALAAAISSDALLSSLPLPELLLVSSAKRTASTAALAFGPIAVDQSRNYYHAGSQEWLAALRLGDQRSVAVVGHNPSVALLVSELIGEDIGAYPPCSLSVLGFDAGLSEIALGDGLLLASWRTETI